MADSIAVEMGETRIAKSPGDTLIAFGLGACVGICLYDPMVRIAAMVHVVLPQTLPAPPLSVRRPSAPPLPGKCADTAVGHVLREIAAQGARVERLQAALVGGAQIFAYSSMPNGNSARLEIGPRNVTAVRKALEQAGIPVIGEDVGGHCGRTVSLHVSNGNLYVRAIGAEEKFLVSLAQSTAAGGAKTLEGARR